jgi:hypothetical protein
VLTILHRPYKPFFLFHIIKNLVATFIYATKPKELDKELEKEEKKVK